MLRKLFINVIKLKRPQFKIYNLKFIILLFLAVGFLFLPQVASAQIPSLPDVGNAITTLLNLILQPVSVLLGSLLSLIIELLIFVAQYNNFTNEPAIATAWVLLRDIGNMFFVVIIVLVGFAEMFNFEKLKAIRVGTFLPKLVIGVLLINFSKGIVGILIDLSQIITLTFVAAFRDVAASNLIAGLNLTNMFSGSVFSGGNFAGQMSLFLNLMMINIILAIAIIIIGMIVALFVTRIVAFWILTVVSPVMMAASVFPSGKLQGYYSDWWKKFGNYLALGPALAFMVWLSFLVLQNGTDLSSVKNISVSGDYTARAQNNQGGVSQIGRATTDASKSTVPGLDFTTILGFVMGAGILVGTIFVAQQVKVVGGDKIAGQAMGALKNTGVYAAKGAGRMAAAGRGFVMGGAGAGLSSLSKKMGGEDTMAGRLLKNASSHAFTVGSEGVTKSAKDAGLFVWNKAKAKLNTSHEKAEQGHKDVLSGKKKGLAAAIAEANYATFRRSPEKKQAKDAEREAAEKAALSGVLSKKGAKAESYNEVSADLVGLKTDAEKYDYLKGAMGNINLSEADKKQVMNKMKSFAKNIGGKKLAEDLIFHEVVDLGSKDLEKLKAMEKNFGQLIKLVKDNQEDADYGDEEAKKKIKNAKKAMAVIASTKEGENSILSPRNRSMLLDRGLGRSDLLDENGKISKESINNLQKEFSLSRKELNDLVAKNISRADLVDNNDRIDTKIANEVASIIGLDRLKGIFHNKMAEGSDSEKTAQWNLLKARIGSNVKDTIAPSPEEQAAANLDLENVRKSMANATDDSARVASVKDYLETGNENHARGIVNQTNINVFNQGLMATDFNKLDSKAMPIILEHFVNQPGLDKIQLSDLLSRLSERDYVNLPTSADTAPDVLNLASVNNKQLKDMSQENLSRYNNLIQELNQTTALGRTGLDVLISKLPENQKIALEGIKNEVEANLKQGEIVATTKLQQKKGKHKK